MPRKTRTTGDLRSILLKALDEVQSGVMEPAKAQAIVKIAAQINMSLLTEAQVGKMNLVANKPVYGLGSLPVAESVEEGELIEHAKAVRYVERPSPPTPTFGDPPPGRSALDQRRREEALS